MSQGWGFGPVMPDEEVSFAVLGRWTGLTLGSHRRSAPAAEAASTVSDKIRARASYESCQLPTVAMAHRGERLGGRVRG